jgi:hypothetical protein
MFEDPKPANLVTVPSCYQHNSQQSMDDEYFSVVVKTASAENPVAERLIRNGVAKRLRKKPALLHKLLATKRQVELRSPGGLIEGIVPAFAYELSRISHVVERITRGFYFKFCGGRLPADYGVNVFPINPKLDGTILQLMTAAQTHTIVPNVFEYKFLLEPREPHFSAWFFRFYAQTLIVSMTDKIIDGNIT